MGGERGREGDRDGRGSLGGQGKGRERGTPKREGRENLGGQAPQLFSSRTAPVSKLLIHKHVYG